MTRKKDEHEHEHDEHEHEHGRELAEHEKLGKPVVLTEPSTIAGTTPSGTPFPFTASINEPQTVSLPVPENVVVPVPNISSILPNECAIGDDDFTLDVSGENFFADSVIWFAGHAEPTTYNEEEKTLSTGVKPSLWTEPVVVKVQIKNGPEASNEVDFTFNDVAARSKRRR